MPDHYYSGSERDLWAEYKYYPKDLEKFNLTLPAKTPKLTKRQQFWLNSRWNEGREVWVIVGMPSGGVILRDKAWMHPVLSQKLWSREEIANAINEYCHNKRTSF